MIESRNRLLIIDTASSLAMRLGLSRADGTISQMENRDRFRYSELIAGMINDLLKNEQVKVTDLDGIIVSTGPGSFTGLRVGMATAKGLAIAAKIPLIGISIFAALSPKLNQQFQRAAIIIPSRRNEYYLGMIDAPEFDTGRIAILSSSDLDGCLGSTPALAIDCDPGELQQIEKNLLTDPRHQLTMEDFLATGLQKLKENGPDDISRLEPLYVQQFPARKC